MMPCFCLFCPQWHSIQAILSYYGSLSTNNCVYVYNRKFIRVCTRINICELLCVCVCVFLPVDNENGLGGAVIVTQPPAVPTARQSSSPQSPYGWPGVWGRHPAPPARCHGAARNCSAQGGVSCTPGYQHCWASEHTGYVIEIYEGSSSLRILEAIFPTTSSVLTLYFLFFSSNFHLVDKI